MLVTVAQLEPEEADSYTSEAAEIPVDEWRPPVSISGSEVTASAWAVGVLHWGKKKKKERSDEKWWIFPDGKMEAEVSSAETDYDGTEWEHCCCLDFPFNEFGIIPETSGENICMNELLLGRKVAYQ